MAARVRCGGRNVCLAEHPMRKLVTDNLDNFSNRGDSHRLSTPSTPQDEATLILPLAPTLPCRGYRGYRSYRSPKRHPCKWRWLDNLAGSSLTPLFLPMVEVVSSLDPLRILYSSACTGPRSHPQYHPVAPKMLKWSSSASSRPKSWFPTRKPSSAFPSDKISTVSDYST